MKKIFTLAFICVLLLASSTICLADDTFKKGNNINIRGNGNQSVSVNFNSLGRNIIVAVQANSNSGTVISMSLGGSKIFERSFSTYQNSIWAKTITDTSTGRGFFAITLGNRAYLFGYVPEKNAIATYVDSGNYHNGAAERPEFDITSNGELYLIFHANHSSAKHVYRLTWDRSKNWFAYRDLGIH